MVWAVFCMIETSGEGVEAVSVLFEGGLVAMDRDKRRKETKREPKKNCVFVKSFLGKMLLGFLVPTAAKTREKRKRKKKMVLIEIQLLNV